MPTAELQGGQQGTLSLCWTCVLGLWVFHLIQCGTWPAGLCPADPHSNSLGGRRGGRGLEGVGGAQAKPLPAFVVLVLPRVWAEG